MPGLGVVFLISVRVQSLCCTNFSQAYLPFLHRPSISSNTRIAALAPDLRQVLWSVDLNRHQSDVALGMHQVIDDCLLLASK